MILSSLLGGGIKSVQRGTLTFGHNTSGSITISSVNLQKASLILSIANGHAGDGNDKVNELLIDAYLSNSTTISWSSNLAMASTTTASGTAYWQVVEVK